MVPSMLGSTHKETLRQVFKSPPPANLEWRKVEALLIALGCQVIEGRGSRVRFAKDGKVAAFHRPHPSKEAQPYQVRYARTYLELLEVQP